MYKSYSRDDNFNYLTFDSDERFIAGGKIYSINDDIIERLKNDLTVDIYMNRM